MKAQLTEIHSELSSERMNMYFKDTGLVVMIRKSHPLFDKLSRGDSSLMFLEYLLLVCLFEKLGQFIEVDEGSFIYWNKTRCHFIRPFLNLEDEK